MELTQPIKDYIEKRMLGLSKFGNSEEAEIMARVEVGKTTKHHRAGDVFRAEIQIDHIGYEKNLRVVAERDDLYAAIDEARERMKEELSETKDKRKSLVKKGARLFKKIILFWHE
jgi:ribosomal subunit interface protein